SLREVVFCQSEKISHLSSKKFARIVLEPIDVIEHHVHENVSTVHAEQWGDELHGRSLPARRIDEHERSVTAHEFLEVVQASAEFSLTRMRQYPSSLSGGEVTLQFGKCVGIPFDEHGLDHDRELLVRPPFSGLFQSAQSDGDRGVSELSVLGLPGASENVHVAQPNGALARDGTQLHDPCK